MFEPSPASGELSNLIALSTRASPVATGLSAAPGSGKSAGELERRIGAQGTDVLAVLIAAGDRQDAGSDHVRDCVRHAGWIAPVRDEARQSLGDPEPSLGLSQEHDAASEERRPPSKAAVIFLRETAGNGKVAAISSSDGYARPLS